MINCQFLLPPSFVSRPSSCVPRKQRKAASGRFSLATGKDTGVNLPVAPSMPEGIGGRFPQKAQSPSESARLPSGSTTARLRVVSKCALRGQNSGAPRQTGTPLLCIVLAIKFLPGAVGGAGHSRLPRASFDLGDMEVEQRQSITPLLVGGMTYQGGNFRQGKDLFHQQIKGTFAHAAHLWSYAFYRTATSDKLVVPLPASALLIIVVAVFQPLDLMLVLLHFGVGLGEFLFQFLA